MTNIAIIIEDAKLIKETRTSLMKLLGNKYVIINGIIGDNIANDIHGKITFFKYDIML